MEKKHQDSTHDKLRKVLLTALKSNVFSACSVGWFTTDWGGGKSKLVHFGRAGEGGGTSAVADTTLFDLASLTKPLCTSLCLLALIEEKQINRDDPLEKYFTIHKPEQKNITILDLINHCSGLPAHRSYYQKLINIGGDKRGDTPRETIVETIVDWILDEKLVYQPGTSHIYSDLGYILLGSIIAKVSGSTLDAYWREKIVQPLSLESELFFPQQPRDKDRIYAPPGCVVGQKEGSMDWFTMIIVGL